VGGEGGEREGRREGREGFPSCRRERAFPPALSFRRERALSLLPPFPLSL